MSYIVLLDEPFRSQEQDRKEMRLKMRWNRLVVGHQFEISGDVASIRPFL